MRKKFACMTSKVLCFCILTLLGCDLALRGREVEIIPGMTWEYCSLRHSRVVWDKYGVIAEGDVFISFYEYGFSFSCDGICRYVDVEHNVLVQSDKALGDGRSYSAMDASSAMGMFSKKTHLEFCKEMGALMERVKERRTHASEK
ncbi:MAG: hypothetical protein SPG40_11180 [Kiritimatiellia bacterium]|nr:hypothetical protein [Kiritimatiellia bacterium]